jgi:hypothetical protein
VFAEICRDWGFLFPGVLILQREMIIDTGVIRKYILARSGDKMARCARI